MDMFKRVVELEGTSSSVPMVPGSDLEALKGEIRLLRGREIDIGEQGS